MQGGRFVNTLSELLNVFHHLDDIRIIDRNGHLIIEGSHHDGNDKYELKRLTRKGYELASNYDFANDRQLHNIIIKSNLFSSLPKLAKQIGYC